MSPCLKLYFGLSKWVCCSIIKLTIACRVIAFVGLLMSLWLIIAFANDKFSFSESNYDVSRKTALILGLDWQHFHVNASLKAEDDPEGKMIAIIVGFYSFSLLGINLMLLIATIRHDWCFSLPWLIIEFLSCVSKFGALIFHWTCDPYEMDSRFFVGSVAYIVLSIWSWLIVFATQMTWRNKQTFDVEMEMFSLHNNSSRADLIDDEYDISPAKMHIYKGSFSEISMVGKGQKPKS